MRHLFSRALACVAAAFIPFAPRAQTSAADNLPVKSLGVVTVTGSRPTSLPTQFPATKESVTAEKIARAVNATDSADALKYLRSLLVRERRIGDDNRATQVPKDGTSTRGLAEPAALLQVEPAMPAGHVH